MGTFGTFWLFVGLLHMVCMSSFSITAAVIPPPRQPRYSVQNFYFLQTFLRCSHVYHRTAIDMSTAAHIIHDNDRPCAKSLIALLVKT